MLYLGKRGLEEVRILFPVVLDDLQQNLLLLLLLITVSPSCSLSTVIYNCHVGHQTFMFHNWRTRLGDCPPQRAGQVTERHGPLTGIDSTGFEE